MNFSKLAVMIVFLLPVFTTHAETTQVPPDQVRTAQDKDNAEQLKQKNKEKKKRLSKARKNLAPEKAEVKSTGIR